MEIKTCQFCKDPIPVSKRVDSKFCSTSCRAKYWVQSKEAIKPLLPAPITESLRGVIDDKPTPIKKKYVFEEREVEVENPEFMHQATAFKRLVRLKGQIQGQILQVQNEIRATLQMDGFGWKAGAAATGAIIGLKKTKGSFWGLLLGITAGRLAGGIVSELTKQEREKQKAQKIMKLRGQLLELQNRHNGMIDESIKMSQELNKLPKYVMGKRKFAVLLSENTQEAETKTEVDLPKIEARTEPELNGNEKIIRSSQLKDIHYKTLNFQEKWKDFFGLPVVTFQCVIHGMAGEGKSTFAIQFANYLAENFGTAIYVSSEEGFSKTFKDKVFANKTSSDFLFVADLRTYNDILKEVKPDQFNFIFLDSLDNMRIDAVMMKQLRNRYKNSALVTISQSTKDGKMRGSYEIVHDADIAVRVENGIATTTKNRFKEKGTVYKVF